MYINMSSDIFNLIKQLNEVEAKMYSKTKHITVKGTSIEEPITVTWRDEDGEIIDCNHAGGDIEKQDFGRYDESDFGNLLVCDKCEFERHIEPEEPTFEPYE